MYQKGEARQYRHLTEVVCDIEHLRRMAYRCFLDSSDLG